MCVGGTRTLVTSGGWWLESEGNREGLAVESVCCAASGEIQALGYVLWATTEGCVDLSLPL